MDSRLRIFLICAFGVAKEFRPSTPFLTPFLESWPKNFTNTQLYSEIYPFSTYSYLLSMIPIFVAIDGLRYKPIVVLEALGLSATWALLLWGETVFQMQLMQIMFGVACSSEIAYVSYVYAVVDKQHFHKITSYVRTATLIGKFFAFSLAQILVTSGTASYMLLNQITFGSVLLSLLIAVSIPMTPERRLSDDDVSSTKSSLSRLDAETSRQQAEPTEEHERNLAVKTRAKSLFSAFRNRTVFMWSLWWSLTSCGVYQVANYVQTLWGPMQHDGQFVGNGFVECSNTLLSAALTFSFQYYKNTLKRFDNSIFFLSSLISALLLYCMAMTTNIWMSYGTYVLNSSIYHLLIAAASAIIAADLDCSNYGLVFGFNTFVALVCQALMTFVINNKNTLALPIRTQFYVYAGFFALIGVIFGSIYILNCCFPTAKLDHADRRHDSTINSNKEMKTKMRRNHKEYNQCSTDSSHL